MVTLVGGVIALILGFLGLVYWWEPFIMILQAGIPLVLILGGALATYLGLEEWRDSRTLSQTGGTDLQDAETERYKEEAEKYKAELEAIKQNQQAAGSDSSTDAS